MSIPRIFDRQAYARQRSRGKQSFIAEDVGAALAYRLRAVNRRFANGLDLSSRDEIHASLAPLADHWMRTVLAADMTGCVVADEEQLPFAREHFDLIVSALSLHAVNDLPGALVQIRQALKPDGLFLAALFGGDTLSELREAFLEGEMLVSGGASPRVY